MNDLGFVVKSQVSIDGAAILSWLRNRQPPVGSKGMLSWLRKQFMPGGSQGMVPIADTPEGTGLTEEEIREVGKYLTSSLCKLAALEGTWKSGRMSITPAGLQSLAEYESEHGPVTLPLSRRKLGHGYRIENNTVFYRYQKIASADPETFEVLNHLWARDANRVYCQSTKMRADRAAFRLLNEIYATDGQHIFYSSMAAKDIDAATFRVLDNGVYLNPGAGNDHIHCGYARDKTNVFYYYMLTGKPKRVRGADPESFRPLQYKYGADNRMVFWEQMRIPGADPAAFKILSEGYSKDKDHVYYYGRCIADADAATFEIIPAMETRPISVRARDHRSEFDRDTRV